MAAHTPARKKARTARASTTPVPTTQCGRGEFDRLPDEIIVKIFQCIAARQPVSATARIEMGVQRDLAALGSTCTRMRRIYWDDIIWRVDNNQKPHWTHVDIAARALQDFVLERSSACFVAPHYEQLQSKYYSIPLYGNVTDLRLNLHTTCVGLGTPQEAEVYVDMRHEGPPRPRRMRNLAERRQIVHFARRDARSGRWVDVPLPWSQNDGVCLLSKFAPAWLRSPSTMDDVHFREVLRPCLQYTPVQWINLFEAMQYRVRCTKERALDKRRLLSHMRGKRRRALVNA